MGKAMTPEREARILIVDDQREVARVLRIALELLELGYMVVDVPSGEEALLELGRVEFDLLVIDYLLPGISGIELLKRVRRTRPEIKAIIITAHSLDEVQDDIRALDVFQIFEKPINTSAFTAAVKFAIDGEGTGALRATVASLAHEPYAPHEDAISRALSSLMNDLGARGIAFIDYQGQPLVRLGALGDVPRFGELATLLANNFIATAEIATYLGDEPSAAVHYYDGSQRDLYALSAGAHFFVTILYPPGSQNQMGSVLHYARPAVWQLAQIVSGGTEAPAPVEPSGAATQAAPAETPETAPEPPATAEPAEGAGMLWLSPEEGQEVAELELDMDDLSAGLVAEEAVDLDSFWEEAASGETRVGDDTLSLDEAVELGLIPKDQEPED
jgi:CheY-like chemotaxis protein